MECKTCKGEAPTFRIGQLSGEARERAREWWRNIEASDPSWHAEYVESREACEQFYAELDQDVSGNRLRTWVINNVPAEARCNQSCPWTGYYLDCVGLDELAEFMASPTEGTTADDLRRWALDRMDRAWDDECAASMEDDAVDDALEANEYEFFADGSRAS